MNQYGSMMISLIAGVFFLVILTVATILLLPRYTQLGTNEVINQEGSEGITGPIDTASNIAAQADLKSIQVALEVYFAENGNYPNSLQELSSAGYTNQGLDISKFSYQTCDTSGTKILVYSGDQGFILNYGEAQNVQGQTSC